MKADDRAVGGFFEDLPVLVFVLAGVSVLVSSAVWAEQTMADARSAAELEFEARLLVETACSDMFPADGVLPTVESLTSFNLSLDGFAAVGCRGYAVSVWERHPEERLLCNSSTGGSVVPDTVACASRLSNALDPEGLVAIVEVRASVW